MSKKEILLGVADNMHSIADSIQKIAECFDDEISSEISTSDVKECPTDISEVRKVLAEKTQSGKSDAVKDLLLKYGVKKLSDIAPENFKNLLKEAEAL